MSKSIPRKHPLRGKRIKKVAYGENVPESKQKNGRQRMNSEPRTISLPSQHVQAAVEEYLHRMKLIDADDMVSVPDLNNLTISVRKEAVH